MKRRQFITLLGSTLAWPLAARAQQPNVFRVGYLEPGSPSDPVQANLRRQFLLGMRDLGYREGQHFTMEDTAMPRVISIVSQRSPLSSWAFRSIFW
jgi:hypothetical protein